MLRNGMRAAAEAVLARYSRNGHSPEAVAVAKVLVAESIRNSAAADAAQPLDFIRAESQRLAADSTTAARVMHKLMDSFGDGGSDDYHEMNVQLLALSVRSDSRALAADVLASIAGALHDDA